MRLSIIIPVYNGSGTIGALIGAIKDELVGSHDVEALLVNDGSLADNSAEVCLALAQENPWVKYIDLSRNFGEHNAVMAGLGYCSGDAAVIIDDDFQNPPSEIVKLVDKLQEGFDVVFSSYERKAHHPLRNLGSGFNNLVASLMIGKPYSLYLSSFKAINRFTIDELVKYRGPFPYIDGLILRTTRRYATVNVRHDPRRHGRSGYTLVKLVSLWMNMFTNFSILPLRFASVVGFVFSIIGLLGAAFCLVDKIMRPEQPAGWASIIVSLLVISGIQLFTIGMVGEYLGRLFMAASGHPQYVVRQTVNLERNKHA